MYNKEQDIVNPKKIIICMSVLRWHCLNQKEKQGKAIETKIQMQYDTLSQCVCKNVYKLCLNRPK